MFRWIPGCVLLAISLTLLLAVACRSSDDRDGLRADDPPAADVMVYTDAATSDEEFAEVRDDADPGERVDSAANDGTPDVVFADFAFPPVIPDTQWHADAWLKNDCLRCHETGVGDAPEVIHRGMPDILLTAKCRTCHVQIPGHVGPVRVVGENSRFTPNAFPPMIPASGYHTRAWYKDDCLLCHENGLAGAPVVRHDGMPPVLLQSKCRTCHVQVRAAFADDLWR